MKQLLFTAVLGVGLVNSTMAATHIVYGDDNRMEPYEAPAAIQLLGKSTAVMVPTNKLVNFNNFYMLPPSTLKEDINLCDGEKFENQLSAGLCSGFLVGPDLLVTAGHCVTSRFDCEKNSWVFDYEVKESTKRADVVTNGTNVFRCKRVIDAKLITTKTEKIDYALIQLDRVVEGREPLKYRAEEKIADGQDVFVIGYPSGLPQKYAPDAQLVDNSDEHFFKANLDTFGGNSGSAVFNSETMEVEGILVRGAKDYVTDAAKKCRTVNTVDHAITDLSKFGESVSRITDIPALKYRAALMQAAQDGNLELIKELAEKNVDLLIADNDNNSALQYAVMNGHKDVVDYIITKSLEEVKDKK